MIGSFVCIRRDSKHSAFKQRALSYGVRTYVKVRSKHGIIPYNRRRRWRGSALLNGLWSVELVKRRRVWEGALTRDPLLAVVHFVGKFA